MAPVAWQVVANLPQWASEVEAQGLTRPRAWRRPPTHPPTNQPERQRQPGAARPPGGLRCSLRLAHRDHGAARRGAAHGVRSRATPAVQTVTPPVTSGFTPPAVLRWPIGPATSAGTEHPLCLPRFGGDPRPTVLLFRRLGHAGVGVGVPARRLRRHHPPASRPGTGGHGVVVQGRDQPGPRPRPGVGLGIVAAWVADECNLGQGPAWAPVNALQVLHELGGNASDLPELPAGAAYVAALHAFLTQHGYCAQARARDMTWAQIGMPWRARRWVGTTTAVSCAARFIQVVPRPPPSRTGRRPAPRPRSAARGRRGRRSQARRWRAARAWGGSAPSPPRSTAAAPAPRRPAACARKPPCPPRWRPAPAAPSARAGGAAHWPPGGSPTARAPSLRSVGSGQAGGFVGGEGGVHHAEGA